jgi:hypothetical protein
MNQQLTPKCSHLPIFAKNKHQCMLILRQISRLFLFPLKAVGYVLLLVLALILVFYLTAPHYEFDEPSPFSGNFINNPYQDTNPEHWLKYNFQVQSRAWGGITDGRKNTNEMIDSIYHLFGYDHVATSDYQRINYHKSEEEAFIPVYEHGYGIRKTHQVCIGAEKVLWIDYPFFQTLSLKQGIIDKLARHNELIALAHPGLLNGYTYDDMKYLSGYNLLEALTNMSVSMAHWDTALSHGHLVYLLANDDAHNVLNSNEVGRRFTMINATNKKRETIIRQLNQGISYGVDFKLIYNEPMQEKIERSKTIPHLVSAQLVNDTFLIHVSKQAAAFRFVGQGGILLDETSGSHSGYYVFRPEDTYVRTEIIFPDASIFYLNPLTRHPSPKPERQYLAHVNHTKTSLYRGVYIILIAVLLRFIYKWQLVKAIQRPNKIN